MEGERKRRDYVQRGPVPESAVTIVVVVDRAQDHALVIGEDTAAGIIAMSGDLREVDPGLDPEIARIAIAIAMTVIVIMIVEEDNKSSINL